MLPPLPAPVPARGDLQNEDRGLLDSPLAMFDEDLSSPTHRASLGTTAGDELLLVNVTVASLLGGRAVGFVVVSVAITSASPIGRVIICGAFLFSDKSKELSALS